VNASYDKLEALVVLPAVAGGRLANGSLRTWLAQSDLVRTADRPELLTQVTGVLGLPYPEEGLAALRMWGQTGERPTVWIAAADPVYLEPRLDHLCLHDLSAAAVSPSEFRTLIEHLQDTLAADKRFGFIRLGQFGYLRAERPIATAKVPACVVDQQVLGDFLPDGAEAAAYRNLVSEIEMALHDHEINQRRAAAGQPPVNALWLWGGGMAPSRTTRAQPPVYCNDPLLLGYWDSANARAKHWPGSIADCIEAQQGAGFVAVVPETGDDAALLEDSLLQLRAALQRRRLKRVTILFRDGRRADITRAHRLRFWRRDSPLLD
jgi:hypothetical protein